MLFTIDPYYGNLKFNPLTKNPGEHYGAQDPGSCLVEILAVLS